MAVTTDEETLHGYVLEAKEHLADIETELLEIEQQGEKCDKELVNKVFRAAHSIKGGAGFLGLDYIKELAHRIENVLDRIRGDRLVPTSNVVNTLLVAFDTLGHLLDNTRESGVFNIVDQVLALEMLLEVGGQGTAITPAEPIAAAPPPAEDGRIVLHHPTGAHRFTLSRDEYNKARQGGRYLYIITIDLATDCGQSGKSPAELIAQVEEGGDIVAATTDLAMLKQCNSGTLPAVNDLGLLYATIIEPDFVTHLTGFGADQIKEAQVATEVSPTPPSQPITAAPKPAPTPAAAAPDPKDGKTGEGKRTIPAPPTGDGGAKNDSLRVNVVILDQLMNRASELVLARNQLVQALTTWDRQSVAAAAQRLDLVTSELQESIMLTRMQPIGNIFSKFPRVVRDLSLQLKKEVTLEIEGKTVELDKTIIEGLGDPLTHLVRNSVDHGIEMPAVRVANGKAATGFILLRAHHESGQVVVEIHDDGQGIDADKITKKAIERGLITPEQAGAMSRNERLGLIMMPGLSTAEAVTEVSGRGVGMDVVKTNLDRLGGQIEIQSERDRGTLIRIKLPLTLAIIPSLLISVAGERFAIPQVNVRELLQIGAGEVRERIARIGEADVLMLRGELIAVVELAQVLKLERTFTDPVTGITRPDRRRRITDERLDPEDVIASQDGETPERRYRYDSSFNIVVVQTGNLKCGIVVDSLHDTVEIVVKPLGRHLKKYEVFAGATIMGDGRVALILDILGLTRTAKLRAIESGPTLKTAAETTGPPGRIRQKLLLFRNGPEEHCALPLNLVRRVEKIKSTDIELRGGKKVVQHGSGHLPLYALEELANVENLEAREELIVIISDVAGHDAGLLAVPPLDVFDDELAVDEETLRQPGIRGSAVIRGKTTIIVDIAGFMTAMNPQWATQENEINAHHPERSHRRDQGETILLVEDSHFFRDQVQQVLEAGGYTVAVTGDGIEALKYLEDNPDGVMMVVTDIEMPNMDGLTLTRRLREDVRFKNLPIIALTTLASDEDIARGKAAGVDDYQVKLERDELMKGIQRLIDKQR